MAVNWKPVFTTAGMLAMQAAHGQGLSVKISHIALGSGVFPVRDAGGMPTDAARALTALHAEEVRVPVGPLSTASEFQVAVQAEIEGGDPAFWIGEVGFITDTGVLLAVWSDPSGLGFRNPEVPWVFKFVLSWSDLPGHMIEVVMPEGDGALTVLSNDIGRIQGKVRHTVEVGGQLEWDDVDNTLLTTAIGNMMDARVDVVVALLDAFDIPFMAGYGPDFAGEDLAVQGYGAVILARNITVLGEIAAVGIVPTGADLILDIEVAGASIYTAQPRIVAGATAITPGVLDPAKADLSAGQVVVLKVTQVGSTAAGQKLTFTLKGKVR